MSEIVVIFLLVTDFLFFFFLMQKLAGMRGLTQPLGSGSELRCKGHFLMGEIQTMGHLISDSSLVVTGELLTTLYALGSGLAQAFNKSFFLAHNYPIQSNIRDTEP